MGVPVHRAAHPAAGRWVRTAAVVARRSAGRTANRWSDRMGSHSALVVRTAAAVAAARTMDGDEAATAAADRPTVAGGPFDGRGRGIQPGPNSPPPTGSRPIIGGR